jgi:aryl-alcohol dehydrogenase-like predicted oxidoreductase
MRYKKLGQTNIEISSIGLGCMGMSIAYGKRDDKESIATLEKALELGVNFWDTSDAYGDNEALIANVLVPHRKQVVIATKFGWRGNPQAPQNGKVDNSPAWIRQALEDSLRRLKTDVIDLYYVHRLDPNIPVEETVGILSGLVWEGKIRAIGLSEISGGTLRRAHAVHPISALQSEYSLLTREAEMEVLPACQQLGTTFVAFSPTARGLLTNTAIDPKNLPNDDRRVTSFPGLAWMNTIKTTCSWHRHSGNWLPQKTAPLPNSLWPGCSPRLKMWSPFPAPKSGSTWLKMQVRRILA